MKKILLVDDDRLILASLSKGLVLSGYEVYSALSGKDALNLADSANFDIAVLDIRMPEMNGLELARQLIQKFDLPVVFLSAYSDNETVNNALNCGCMAFLVKPCSLKQLVLTIETICNKSQEINRIKEHHRHLNKALSQSQNICIAIGILMKQLGIDQRQASEKLRKDARSSRQKISELADQIVSKS